MIAVCVAATLACTQASPIETEPASLAPIVQPDGAEPGASAPTAVAQPSQAKLATPIPNPVTPLGKTEPLASTSTAVAQPSQAKLATPIPNPVTPLGKTEPLASTSTAVAQPSQAKLATPIPNPVTSLGKTEPLASTSTAAEQRNQTNLAVPTPTPVVHYHASPYSYVEAPLDSRIYYADVVALVSLRDAKGQFETIPGDADVAPTHRPALVFRFDVIEYLKGAGEDEIVVWDPAPQTFLTSEEAQANAEHKLAVRRNSTWDDRAAVVFLHVLQEGDPDDASHVRHGFATINFSWGEHTIDDLGKAWLPANALTPDGQDVVDFVRSAGDGLELLTDSDPNGGSDDLPLIFTLGELRSRMEAVATLLEEGKDIEGYEECIVKAYSSEHWIRSWEARNGPFDERPVVSEQVSSGEPANTEFDNAGLSGGEFSNWWLTGADAELFSVDIVDGHGKVLVPDDRYPVYYHISFTVSRPLPNGTYRFNLHNQQFSHIPCDYTTLPRPWEVTAVPPNGTVHEAFFDPVESGGTAGASETIGILKPRDFKVEGVETTPAGVK